MGYKSALDPDYWLQFWLQGVQAQVLDLYLSLFCSSYWNYLLALRNRMCSLQVEVTLHSSEKMTKTHLFPLLRSLFRERAYPYSVDVVVMRNPVSAHFKTLQELLGQYDTKLLLMLSEVCMQGMAFGACGFDSSAS